MRMDCGLLDNSQDQVLINLIAARAVINLFPWQLHIPLHGEMAKKIYDVTGITSVGANVIIADPRIFKDQRYVATNPPQHSVASNSHPIYGDNG
jgi:hypothetical protein